MTTLDLLYKYIALIHDSNFKLNDNLRSYCINAYERLGEVERDNKKKQ